MPPTRPNKSHRYASPVTGKTRGDSPMKVPQRAYPSRPATQSRSSSTRGSTRNSAVYQSPQNSRAQTSRQSSRGRNNRLSELQNLLEVSKAISSSIQLKKILDTLLQTSMAKTAVTKGIVLSLKSDKLFIVETLKGLRQSHIGKKLEVNWPEPQTMSLNDIKDTSNWLTFLTKLSLTLVVPIVNKGRCLAILAFNDKSNKESYSSEELEYLKSLANLVAPVVESALAFQSLADDNSKLDKKNQSLTKLFKLSNELNATLESDKMINVLTSILIEKLATQRCIIFTEEEDNLILQSNDERQDITIFEDKEFLSWIRTLTQTFRIESLKANSSSNSSKWYKNLKEWNLIVPISGGKSARGIILIGHRASLREYKDDEIEFVSILGKFSMLSLEKTYLFRQAVAKQKKEKELAIAQAIQERILLGQTSDLQGYEIALFNMPMHKFGGDYYDSFAIDSQRHVVAIAEIPSNGIPAALLKSNLQAMLRAMMATEIPLVKIVERINKVIHQSAPQGKFITFFVGILDLERNSLTYVNAGQKPPYLFHNNDVPVEDSKFQLLAKGGFLLGMSADTTYESETVLINQGDWVLMYTDGVSEAINENEEEFTEERIEQMIRSGLSKKYESAVSMLDFMTAEVKGFMTSQQQRDDLTLMTLHCSDIAKE